jgi:hypothetical protein
MRPAAPVLPEIDPLAARRLDLAADGTMDVADAERFLSLGTTEVYALMNQGVIAWAKHGKRRLVSRRSCVEFLAARMVVDPKAEGTGEHDDDDGPRGVHGAAGVPAAGDQPGGVPPRVGGRVQSGRKRGRGVGAAAAG